MTQRWPQLCCFERFFPILVICLDSSSCLSQNVSLIIQIWRVLLLLNGGMYQAILHIDHWMVYNPSKRLVLNLWFSQHSAYSCHYVQVRGLHKKNRKVKMIKQKYKENTSHLCFLISSDAAKIIWFILPLSQLSNW